MLLRTTSPILTYMDPDEILLMASSVPHSEPPCSLFAQYASSLSRQPTENMPELPAAVSTSSSPHGEDPSLDSASTTSTVVPSTGLLSEEDRRPNDALLQMLADPTPTCQPLGATHTVSAFIAPAANE